MNKLILAFTLLLTPFFSSISTAEIYVPADSVSPDVDIEKIVVSSNVSQDHIGQVFNPDADFYCSYSGLGGYASVSAINVVLSESALDFSCDYVTEDGSHYPSVGGISFLPESVKSCPPEAFPNYIYSIDIDEDGEIDVCVKDNPALEQCPQGNYKYKLAGGCVPIECGSSGSQSTMWASGGTYNNTTGTYCDGSCAHSVSGGQNSDNYSGNIGISGVSTGEVCGQGGIEDRWHNEGVGDDCVSENGFLSCPNGNTPDAPTDTEPTVDLESEQVSLEEITPLIPVQENCDVGDPSCEIRNLKETIVTKGLEQKEIDALLHNKKIAADEKTSTKIIDGINDSSGRNLQGLEIVTAAVNGLKDSIGTGGGGASTGNGFGDGDVTCDGDDCEGDVLTDIEPSEGLVGYWESEYEDGLEGMFLGKLEEYKQTEFFLFLEQFKPQISGGAAPNYNWCFNFGQYMNLGCHNLSIDPRVFPALKIFILISAAFACRAILFGG